MKERLQVTDIDLIFNKITEENFPQTKERHPHTDTRSIQNTKHTEEKKISYKENYIRITTQWEL